MHRDITSPLFLAVGSLIDDQDRNSTKLIRAYDDLLMTIVHE